MRLLIISTMNVYPWGGSEELWRAVALAAAEAGHTVCVATYRWPRRAPQVQAMIDRGIQVIERRRRSSGRLTRAINQISNPLAGVMAFKPDVIYVNQGGTYDAAYGHPESTRLLELLTEAGKPYALVCQSLSDMDVPPDPARPPIRQLFSGAAWVGFVAGAMIRTAERHLAHQITNARVVRNPVNLATPTAEPWPAMSPTARFAAVARLEARKGLDLLLQALAADAWRSRNWSLAVYGDGPLRKYYEELARSLEIAQRVRFYGHVGDVRSIWRDNEVLVLPSYFEGTPLAIVEAMLLGRPAIATDVGGAREWIKDGHTGFVAQAPSVYSIAETLERAWAARDHWPAMGQAAHQLASSQYDPEPGKTLLQQLETLLRR